MRQVGILLLCIGMLGCGGLQTRAEKNAEPKGAGRVIEPVSTAADKALDPVVYAQQTMEQRFLLQAEKAFRSGRLTSPAHDNAYDRFHSVLLINPDNQMARSGLQAILIRYAELIRQALASSDYGGASRYLQQAQVYYPGNSLLLELQKQARSTQLHYEEATLARSPKDVSVQEFELPISMLGKSEGDLIPFLGSIAQRVRGTGESVMIYARTDSEGRWVYQQLKKAVPGYRIRGDIRIAKQPKIALFPPL